MITIAITNSSNIEGGANTNFTKYKRDITIQNNEASDLVGYQVCIEIADVDFFFKADPNNLVLKDGDNILPYWVETWKRPDGKARIWTKLDLPANSSKTISLYYGGYVDWISQDGDSVFEFFDDFDGESLDTNKWSTSYDVYHEGISMDTWQSNSLLHVKLLANDNIAIIANSFDAGGDFKVNVRGYIETCMANSQWGLIFCYNKQNRPDDAYYFARYNVNTDYLQLKKTLNTSETVLADLQLYTQYNKLTVTKLSNNLKVVAEWGQEITATDDEYIDNTGIGLFAAYDKDTIILFDHFFVAKSIQNEPTIQISSETEMVAYH